MLRLPDYKKVIKGKPICLLDETHNYIKARELLRSLNNDVFVDRVKSCFSCEQVTQRKYAVAVNIGAMDIPYECYLDTYVDTGFDNIIISDNSSDPLLEAKLGKLQKDLRVFHSEKKYDVKPVTREQKLEFLHKQIYQIEDCKYPFNTVRDSKVKYKIYMPPDREFTLPSEDNAIHTLSTIPTKTDFHRKCFVIYEEAN